jgi:hypothetical protein
MDLTNRAKALEVQEKILAEKEAKLADAAQVLPSPPISEELSKLR